MNIDARLLVINNNKIRSTNIDGDIYYVGIDVAKLLGYSDISSTISKQIEISNRTTLYVHDINMYNNHNEIINTTKHNSLITFINKNGVSELIMHTKNISSTEKYKLLDEFKTVVILKDIRETSFMTKLCKFLDSFDIAHIKQFVVGDYRVDMYLPDHNIVIEYDEEHHDRQIEDDILREDYLKLTLGCHIIRCSFRDSNEINIIKVFKFIWENFG